MQRSTETRAAQQAHAFSDAKTERHQTLAEFFAGIKGQYGSALAGAESVQRRDYCSGCHGDRYR